jgi:hypothetical protein
MRKFIVGAVVATGMLVPAAPALAGQSWLAKPLPATTPCSGAASHVWCGLGNNDGSYDRTYHWWEIGVCLFGCPESA